MVVCGTVEHTGQRVAALVVLDAFVPADGDSVDGLLGGHVDDTVALGRPWLVDGPARA